MTEPTYYLNGEYVPASGAALPLNDLSIVRGYGVFDLLRTYARVPFYLRDHVARLENSARLIGITLPWSTEELEFIIHETHARNPYENATIRIIVTGGASQNYMTPPARPTLVVMVNPLVPYPAEQFERGCKVITTQIERIMPTVKSLNYIGAIMAMAEGDKVGAVEAIYHTEIGLLTEGTRSNLFAVEDGRLITPEDAVLKGITRQVVLEIAREELEVVETSLRYDQLAGYDELFLTSSTKEILPVVQCDEKVIGQGKPGPITLRLMARFREYVEEYVAKYNAMSAAGTIASVSTV